MIPFGFMKEVSGGNPELYVESDAADPINEANSVGGNWVGDGATITSVSYTGDGGLYGLEIEALSTSYDRGVLSLSLDDATDYTIKIKVIRTVGNITTARFLSWQGFTTSPNVNVTGSIVEYIFNMTTNLASQEIRVYTNTASNGAIGDKLIVSVASIIKD